ncbi:Ger(x)C family spore germination protein [Heyndrickxia sp. NPDC080065]|uniref:Ger(x)C family spore germination protein n=1 Tax=Heyndrickxia sp. NPDC080065 TaxID=3390568 RepID=UPI003CFCB74A
MKKILVFSFSLIVLSGCVQQQIIDKLNIETAQGYDLAENNNIKGTVLYPQYLPDKSVQNQTLSTIDKTSRDILSDLERNSNKPLVTGGLQVVILGDSFAKKGLAKLIDSLERDPNIGSRMLLAVTDSSAEEILQGEYGYEGNGTYISDLLKHNMKFRDVPKMNVHLFASYYVQKGKDAFLPIIQKIDNNRLKITGMALFKNDIFVKRINENRMFYFKLLVDRYSEGTQIVQMGKKQAVVRSIRSHNKIKVNKKKSPQEIIIKIKVNAVLREYSGKKATPKIIYKISKQMEGDIKKESLHMLKEFQKRGIDPVGIGQNVKIHTKNFDFKKWKGQYKNVTFKVIPKVTIMESGTIE